MNYKSGQLSSYLAIKGGMSDPTYRAFSEWELTKSVKDNMSAIERSNNIGASSLSWLKQFLRVMKQRYDLIGSDRRLIELVKQGWHLDDWKPVQLWHMSRNDELLRLFVEEWLFDKYDAGIVVNTAEPVVEYLHSLVKSRLGSVDAWKENTYRRVANGLLKIATEFHLMRGRVNREFTAYRLPEKCLIYLLHALMEREQNTRKVVEAADWRMFMMKPGEVEEELLRLHQYGKLRFERAGSFLELTLPCESTTEYVRSAIV